MFKYFKHPEIPDSSPDKLTFPFEFKSFQFTMDNYVKSYTRNRVTKENLTEVLEEVNASIKGDSDGFKTWDYLSVIFLLLINASILGCILTIQIKYFMIFAIKLGAILVGITFNFIIYACCLNSSMTVLRDKIQNVLDSKDEYFDSKGMRWGVCLETDFPYWIELHIRSQFEMKLQKEKQEARRKAGQDTEKETTDIGYSEEQGIRGNQLAKSKKHTKGGAPTLMRQTDKRNGFAELGIEENDEEYETSQVQPKPKAPQEIDIDMDNKKFNRLYAPLDEDYEENYEDEEANM